jgi:SAM-dependent methyltransferase
VTVTRQAGLRAAVFERYADWYDAFNRGKDYAAEIQYVLKHVEALAGRPRRWLDVGCGTGHHLGHLYAAGIDVEGVDQSSTMIERARRAHPQIRFHIASAQTFALAGDRDVVSMLFHVMSYQDSDEKVRSAFERVRAHLAPHGVFVFDFWHSDGVAADPPAVRVRETIVDGRSLFRLANPLEHRERRLIEIQYQFRLDAPDGPLAHEEVHVMRHFTEGELEACLRTAGMDIVRSDGWMTGRRLSTSDWYGFVCARVRTTE